MKVVLMHVKAFGGFWMALSTAVSISLAAETARAGVPSDKLTLGYTTVGAILTPVWIPAEMGIFQKYGLDVDMKLITTGPVVVSALIAGEIGIAAASGEPIVRWCPFHEWKRIQSPCGRTAGTLFGAGMSHVRQRRPEPSLAEM